MSMQIVDKAEGEVTRPADETRKKKNHFVSYLQDLFFTSNIFRFSFLDVRFYVNGNVHFLTFHFYLARRLTTGWTCEGAVTVEEMM